MTSTPRPPTDPTAYAGNGAAMQRGTTGGRVFAFIVGFVVLAAIGASLGWWLTPVHPANAASPP
ncbi:MAG TPA: hypothetical protein VH442_07165, partial [Micromonosporaceae bacterium]